MIDTHAHLLYYNDRTEEIIKKMQNDGLEKIINIGTTVENSREGQKLAEKNTNVYATVGIYPEYAGAVTEQDLIELEKLTKLNKVVAVGEIGLDYHSEGFDKEAQKKVLIKQLEIADRANLPFCIHCRGEGAAEDLYEILSSHKNLIRHSALMHCYSEGSKWYKKFLELGMYLSFSGNITYKKSDRSFLKDVPLDKILVETDSPYLSPEPKRGTENQPKNVRFVLEKIAFEIGISFDELEQYTCKNAKKFYGIE